MSLLVHELLIGTGGGGSGATNLQTSPSNPVPIASVTVTHSNSTVQVAHLQQSRVVTITSSHSRLTPTDKASRLASALAGNPPYSYSSNCSPQRYARSQSRLSLPLAPGTSPIISTHPDSFKPSNKALSSTRQTYILPFVLQDHNYGAPPPHSPPPPPPPLSVSTSQPYIHKVHVPSPNVSAAQSPKTNLDMPCNLAKKLSPKGAVDQPILTHNNVGTAQISPVSCPEIVPPPLSSPTSITSQIMASMPLPRQQFMPHPKTPIYPLSNLSPSSSICDSLITSTVPLPLSGGQDTDEESRLSDRSSSVGPSGEETETAPEGEGEEQIQADDSITRCICNFTHDDGYMIQCDRCFVWQHVDCMEIDRNNIPDEYLCEACKPRLTDKSKARALQVRRRQEIRAHLARISSSDSEDNVPTRSKSTSNGKSQERKVLKKKKPKTSKENKSNRKQTITSKNLTYNSTNNNNLKSLPLVEDREIKPLAIKSRRRQSTISGSSQNSGDDSCGTTFTIDQLRSWINVYEVAVTNHYSPELRAKVHAARINGISAEFRESTQGALLGHRCRVAPTYDISPDNFEEKILVAAMRLQPSTAIIEYQGKYTLKSQWNSVQIPAGMPYLPFVLQYNMEKEGLSVCVDARTYGNDARFARRSSNYNAEILHVVERGSVHLYIVACKEIEEEEEILLPLDTAICQQNIPLKTCNFAQTVNPNKEIGNEKLKEDGPKMSSNISQVKKNGVFMKKNMRKPLLSLPLPQPLNRTSRRTTSSESHSCDDTSTSSIPSTLSPVKQRRSSGCGGGNKSPSKCAPSKSPSKSPSKATAEDSSSGESPHHDSPGSDKMTDSHKMTREERKIAAYMKAFERMEKAAQRRQEMEKRKVEDRGRKGTHTEDEDASKVSSADESMKSCLHENERKKGKKKLASPRKSEYFEEDNNGSSSEGERKAYEGSLTGYSSPPSSGVSSAGFRFPKTKKALMNEWLNETVDPVLHSTPQGVEVTTGVPTCYMRSPSTPMRRNSGSVCSSTPGVVEMVGRSAKKRWLRQAIIDETDPHTIGFPASSSPNSRPDSPNGSTDYITPLKKRRLARESMSSEQSNTPPSTPLHPEFEEKYNEEMEIDHALDENFDPEEQKLIVVKKEENNFPKDLLDVKNLKEEEEDTDYGDVSDRLTINISQISAEIKSESIIKFETDPCPKDLGLTPSLSNVKIEKESEDEEECEVKNESKPVAVDKNGKSPQKCSKTERRRKGKESKPSRPAVSVSSHSAKKRPTKKKSHKSSKCKSVDQKKTPKKRRKTSPKCKPKKEMEVNKKGKSKEKETNITESVYKEIPKLNLPNNEVETTVTTPNNEVETTVTTPNNEVETTVTTITSDQTQPEKVQEDIPKDFVTPTKNELSPRDPDEKKGPRTPEGTPPEHLSRNDVSCESRNDLESEGDVFSGPNEVSKEDQDRESEGCKAASEETANVDSEIKSESSSNPETTTTTTTSTDDSKLDAEANLSPVPEVMSVCTKPAAVKRKLSILEYRKRKSISCESELKEECYPKSSIRGMMSAADATVENEALNTSMENVGPVRVSNDPGSSSIIAPLEDIISRPLPPLSPTLMVENVKTDKAKTEGCLNRNSGDDCQDVKWNAAPTLLEQQRENLTARLRRDFGLCLPEDSGAKLKLGDKSGKEKWSDIERRFPYSRKRPSLPSAVLQQTTSTLTSLHPPNVGCSGVGGGLKPPSSLKVSPVVTAPENKVPLRRMSDLGEGSKSKHETTHHPPPPPLPPPLPPPPPPPPPVDEESRVPCPEFSPPQKGVSEVPPSLTFPPVPKTKLLPAQLSSSDPQEAVASECDSSEGRNNNNKYTEDSDGAKKAPHAS